MAVGRKYDHLMDLQRTVNTLVGQLRDVQWEMQREHAPFWKHFSPIKSDSMFMSEVCNRRIRPNVKMVTQPDSGQR